MKYIKNQKGAITTIEVLAYLPFIIYLIVYLVMGGLFLAEKNELNTIVNKKLDRAIVEGQFTVELKEELVNELDSKGFKEEKLEITITPDAADDSNNNTYISRGNEISIKVIYKKTHTFYYLNFAIGEESTFYPKAKVTGMSEKW
ncbi:hypothetical protein RBQ61_02780 [Sedimentibacter sp. MB35-C1]|uniref:hypothetical protein n=1 Tax=Sedimentibacter sp. MB35-C1 TaxID=3070995 RepID=UPI0027DF1783|nr:hypothetical protein [Sedimentibacter sp. MB35-C1]WMJ77870.1 hypothetical protein RBQ61_02780 [Sedimentibacter sp. MB35-C1]